MGEEASDQKRWGGLQPLVIFLKLLSCDHIGGSHQGSLDWR